MKMEFFSLKISIGKRTKNFLRQRKEIRKYLIEHILMLKAVSLVDMVMIKHQMQ
jgi:hypothetical protein